VHEAIALGVIRLTVDEWIQQPLYLLEGHLVVAAADHGDVVAVFEDSLCSR